MIQIYVPNNSNFKSNGDSVLLPISCELDSELNKTWELTLIHPIDDDNIWKLIENGAVIAAPTFVNEKQLFRIYNTVKTDYDVTAYARPIFMDSANEVYLNDCRPTNKTAQNALNIMLSGQTKYKGISDITKTSTAYYIRKNFMQAVCENEDQSFLNRWGGEIWYENYTIHILNRIGGDYGVNAEFGHNVTGIESDISMDSVITRIVPVSFNGYTLDGESPWVNSPLINSYPIVYTRVVEFENVKLQEDCSEGETGFSNLSALRAELIRQCNLQFSAGVDKPTCNYSCDMVELSHTNEYSDVQILEQVGLGDTVHCKNKRLEIVTDARAIKVKWDCIKNQNISIELGDFGYDYFKNIASSFNNISNNLSTSIDRLEEMINGSVDGVVQAEKIRGVINGMVTSLRVQNTVSQKQKVRAILFEDLDKNSSLYGAMALGTQGFEIASERTVDGKEWKWSTFGTSKGFIATYLIAGMLSSTNYNGIDSGFCINLDEGTIDSKNLKLNANGLLSIYKAYIEGGSIEVSDKDGSPIFVVNENGFGLGSGAEDIMYLYNDGFVRINNSVRLLGQITNYGSNGNPTTQIGNSQFEVYDKNKNGNFVGALGTTYEEGDSNVGVYSYGDKRVDIGTITGGDWRDKNGWIISNMISVYRGGIDMFAVPYIVGGWSGTFECGNEYGRIRVTVQTGIITNIENI